MRSTCFSGLWGRSLLIWHVWAEVVFNVSDPPTGQLILWQVEAEAAQLENCGLGFWSLRNEHETVNTRSVYLNIASLSKCPDTTDLQVLSVQEKKHRLIWVVHHHPSLVLTAKSVQKLLLIVPMVKFKLGL